MPIMDPLLLVISIPIILLLGFVNAPRVTKPPQSGSLGGKGGSVGTVVFVGVKVSVAVGVFVGVSVFVRVGVFVGVSVFVRTGAGVRVGVLVIVGGRVAVLEGVARGSTTAV